MGETGTLGTVCSRTIEELAERHKDSAFLVDFDGTMVDLAPHPEKIDVPLELVDDLQTIAASDDIPFAIVSGRPLSKLEKFLPGVLIPSIGSGGAEMRSHKDAPIEQLAPPLPPHLRKEAHTVGKKHGCFFEDKEYSLSFHLPFTHMDDDLAAEFAASLGENRLDFIIRKVGRTYEILQSGFTKGAAIERLMRLPAFKDRTPIYIGDDVQMDESLRIIPKMGGVLVPVRFMHHRVKSKRLDDDAFSSDDVRKLVSLLAERVSRTHKRHSGIS